VPGHLKAQAQLAIAIALCRGNGRPAGHGKKTAAKPLRFAIMRCGPFRLPPMC